MNDIVPIPLTRGLTAYIDAEDAERVLQFKWHAHITHGKPYARRSFQIGSRTTGTRQIKHEMLHNFILGVAPDGMEIDHIDGNGLNNTRKNLRFCTSAQNSANRGMRSDNTSGYRGVWQQSNGRWEAVVRTKGKYYACGTFTTAKEAAIARDIKAKEVFGDFAWLNCPEITRERS